MNMYVKLEPDLFATNQNNYIAETVILNKPSNFPYYIFSPFQGGFYIKDIELYDENGNLLVFNSDYVVSYYFENFSKRVGLDVYQAVIIINQNIKNKVTLYARYVGGDLAYSFTVVNDYVNFWSSDVHVPFTEDYTGYEPKWAPGELDQLRWNLDRHYNFDYAIFKLAETLNYNTGTLEDTYRSKFDKIYADALTLQTDAVQHINDINNPHKLDNTDIGLNNIYNYPLATYVELINNVAGRYVTPKISLQGIPVLFDQPYQQHATILGNPHQNTAEQYASYSVSYVDNQLTNKWKLTDTVNNAGKITDGSVTYDSQGLINYLNGKLNTTNFIDLIPTLRLGSFTIQSPILKDHVLGNNQTWQNWNDLSNTYKDYLGYVIYTLSGVYAAKASAVTAANATYKNITRGLVKYVISRTITTANNTVTINTTGLLSYKNGSWS